MMPFTSYRSGTNDMSFLGGYAFGNSSGNDMTGSQLQSTIAAATSGIGKLPEGVAHHPITCTDKLFYDENGVLSCEHFEVPSDDPRTQAALIHSLALMIIEEAMLNFHGLKELPYERYT